MIWVPAGISFGFQRNLLYTGIKRHSSDYTDTLRAHLRFGWLRNFSMHTESNGPSDKKKMIAFFCKAKPQRADALPIFKKAKHGSIDT